MTTENSFEQSTELSKKEQALEALRGAKALFAEESPIFQDLDTMEEAVSMMDEESFEANATKPAGGEEPTAEEAPAAEGEEPVAEEVPAAEGEEPAAEEAPAAEGEEPVAEEVLAVEAEEPMEMEASKEPAKDSDESLYGDEDLDWNEDAVKAVMAALTGPVLKALRNDPNLKPTSGNVTGAVLETKGTLPEEQTPDQAPALDSDMENKAKSVPVEATTFDETKLASAPVEEEYPKPQAGEKGEELPADQKPDGDRPAETELPKEQVPDNAESLDSDMDIKAKSAPVAEEGFATDKGNAGSLPAEQKPDGDRPAETSLPKEQVPDGAASLDSGMVDASRGPVSKEASAVEGEEPAAEEVPVEEGEEPAAEEVPVEEGEEPVAEEVPVEEGEEPVAEEVPAEDFVIEDAETTFDVPEEGQDFALDFDGIEEDDISFDPAGDEEGLEPLPTTDEEGEGYEGLEVSFGVDEEEEDGEGHAASATDELIKQLFS